MSAIRSALSDRARAAVSADAVLALAQELVRIPTENPPGDTRAACAALAARLETAGFTCEEFEATPPHVSLIATHEFSPGGRSLVLNGHLDVVPVGEGWTKGPFSGEVVDGKLYGRGAVDMKGAVAAMAVAAASLVRAGLPLGGRLVVMAVADEEQGGVHGSGAIVDSGRVEADAVVIGEPSDGGVVVAHRGTCFVRVRTYGRSGHASMPVNFDNAVERMVDVLTASRELELTYEPHPLLGAPTIAIGTTITGGKKMNVVPDECEATLDIRTVPGMTPARVVEELVAHLVARGFRTTEEFEVEVIVSSEQGVTALDAEIVTLASEASAREFGGTVELRGMTATTDGWYFSNRAGIPTVMGLGPGSIRGCHVVDESVEVTELESYARVYADMAAHFLSVDKC
jgi:succinyl-diaminopimelate desuccinylase